jgi:hypothetical protein
MPIITMIPRELYGFAWDTQQPGCVQKNQKFLIVCGELSLVIPKAVIILLKKIKIANQSCLLACLFVCFLIPQSIFTLIAVLVPRLSHCRISLQKATTCCDKSYHILSPPSSSRRFCFVFPLYPISCCCCCLDQNTGCCRSRLFLVRAWLCFISLVVRRHG